MPTTIDDTLKEWFMALPVEMYDLQKLAHFKVYMPSQLAIKAVTEMGSILTYYLSMTADYLVIRNDQLIFDTVQELVRIGVDLEATTCDGLTAF